MSVDSKSVRVCLVVVENAVQVEPVGGFELRGSGGHYNVARYPKLNGYLCQ
jgi:hypothetical protein